MLENVFCTLKRDNLLKDNLHMQKDESKSSLPFDLKQTLKRVNFSDHTNVLTYTGFETCKDRLKIKLMFFEVS